jgi:hypothetical protein
MGTADGSVIGITQVVNHGDPSSRWNLVILGDGYRQSDLARFDSDAQNFITTMNQTAPFDELWNAVNVYRIDVASTNSGAADPVACGGTGAAPHTYFDATFCGDGQVRRLLTVNNDTVHGVVNRLMPQAHMIIVIVNSTIYGGSGGGVATFSIAGGADQIALHEMGHTAFGFADEYESYQGCGIDPPGTHDRYVGGEPGQPNVTIDTNLATNKWKALIAPATPMPTTQNADCAQCDPQPNPFPDDTVGTYEGARYFHCGVYRPQFNCRMRVLGFPFCAVCQSIIRTTFAPFIAVVRGIVTDSQRNPIPSATVRMTQSDAGVPGILETTTDAKGFYSISMSPGGYDGRYTVDVFASGFEGVSITIDRIVGSITENFILLRIGILAGLVTDTNGKPLAGALVLVGEGIPMVGQPATFTSFSQTDSTGRYSMLVDPPGVYNAAAFHSSFEDSNPLPVTVSLDTTKTQNFALVKATPVSVSGLVTDSDSQDPIAGATVVAIFDPSSDSVTTKTDGSGNYSLSNVLSGRRPISASHRGYSSETQTIKVTVAGPNVANFSLNPKRIIRC